MTSHPSQLDASSPRCRSSFLTSHTRTVWPSLEASPNLSSSSEDTTLYRPLRSSGLLLCGRRRPGRAPQLTRSNRNNSRLRLRRNLDVKTLTTHSLPSLWASMLSAFLSAMTCSIPEERCESDHKRKEIRGMLLLCFDTAQPLSSLVVFSLLSSFCVLDVCSRGSSLATRAQHLGISGAHWWQPRNVPLQRCSHPDGILPMLSARHVCHLWATNWVFKRCSL